MKKAAPYILSVYSFIFTDTLDQILNVGYPKHEGNPIPSFDENLLIDLCSEAQQVFEKESNTLDLEGDFIIVGDIHGSFHDLLRILKFIQEKNTKVLFLGDYVDRGLFSLECITILFAMKVMYPDSFYLIRGNHEFEQLCRLYGFKNEIINYYDPKKQTNISHTENFPSMKKSQSLIIDTKNTEEDELFDESYSYHCDMYCYRYTEKLYYSFIKVFSYLPICAIINKTTFCIHGGLSPKFNHADEINKMIPKPITNFEANELLSDVVWSDPSYSFDCPFEDNPRGRGYLFNAQVVLNFLKNNSFVRIIRAHQCVINGSLQDFNNKCITVFSASSYDKEMGNASAVLELFQRDDTFKITTFSPLRRLQKCEAVYYKVQALNMPERKITAFFSLQHPTLCINAQQMPDFMLGSKYHNSKSTPLLVPKFTTNSRKSYSAVKKPTIIKNNVLDIVDIENSNDVV